MWEVINMNYVTFSWDDGCKEDIRMCELFSSFGKPCTFYIPAKNPERETLLPNEIKSIGQIFDIGGHTYDHIPLTTISLKQAILQIKTGKEYLESILGRSIAGFCFPKGEWSKELHQEAIQLGFKYTRLTGMFYSCLFKHEMLRTTLQFYPHTFNVYCIHLLKRLNINGFCMFLKTLPALTVAQRIKRLIKLGKADNLNLHFWGHSWDLEEHQLWEELKNVIKILIDEGWIFKDNTEFVKISVKNR